MHHIYYYFCFIGLNEVDYSHYPGRDFQLQWLHSYLEAYKEHKGQGSAVTDREVESLYVQVNQFALVSICSWSSVIYSIMDGLVVGCEVNTTDTAWLQ